jgi:hypothetical protein
VLTVAGKVTEAVSVAKLTVAVTPSSLFSFFSILAAHEAQVIPPTASSALRVMAAGASAGLSPATVLIRITFPCTTVRSENH